MLTFSGVQNVWKLLLVLTNKKVVSAFKTFMKNSRGNIPVCPPNVRVCLSRILTKLQKNCILKVLCDTNKTAYVEGISMQQKISFNLIFSRILYILSLLTMHGLRYADTCRNFSFHDVDKCNFNCSFCKTLTFYNHTIELSLYTWLRPFHLTHPVFFTINFLIKIRVVWCERCHAVQTLALRNEKSLFFTFSKSTKKWHNVTLNWGKHITRLNNSV